MMRLVPRVCPICGKEYTDIPALSRLDNTTLICPDCGTRQALETINVVDRESQDYIINLARKERRR